MPVVAYSHHRGCLAGSDAGGMREQVTLLLSSWPYPPPINPPTHMSNQSLPVPCTTS
jgi:hypothetical protein